MNGTTIKLIGQPLKQAVDDLVAATAMVGQDEPLTPQRQLQTMTGLYRQLTSTLEHILPLLGLVLFGDPQVARRFYLDGPGEADRTAELLPHPGVGHPPLPDLAPRRSPRFGVCDPALSRHRRADRPKSASIVHFIAV
jgi:hypothetical protein